MFINHELHRGWSRATFPASWKSARRRGGRRRDEGDEGVQKAWKNQNGVEKKRPGGSLKGNGNSEVKGFGQEDIDTP